MDIERVARALDQAHAVVSKVRPEQAHLPASCAGWDVRGSDPAASKTVLNGGVGTMVELARANLRNVPRRRAALPAPRPASPL